MTPAELRPLRIVSILERIDHPDARELLGWLAKESPSERVKSDAKRALRPAP